MQAFRTTASGSPGEWTLGCNVGDLTPDSLVLALYLGHQTLLLLVPRLSDPVPTPCGLQGQFSRRVSGT